jgi:hypothetical protein
MSPPTCNQTYALTYALSGSLTELSVAEAERGVSPGHARIDPEERVKAIAYVDVQLASRHDDTPGNGPISLRGFDVSLVEKLRRDRSPAPLPFVG